MSETVGFIGLGVMGRPMARHLVDNGYTLVVYNRSRPAVDELAAAGAVPMTNGQAVGKAATVVITMLPDAPEVDDVLNGEGGVLSSLQAGSVVVDMSTIAPAAARRLAEMVGRHGSTMLDAPVSGGEVGARAGTLSIMAGGEHDLQAGRAYSSLHGAAAAYRRGAGLGPDL
jgi:2-hydroxy-3-oxopropionate reductase